MRNVLLDLCPVGRGSLVVRALAPGGLEVGDGTGLCVFEQDGEQRVAAGTDYYPLAVPPPPSEGHLVTLRVAGAGRRVLRLRGRLIRYRVGRGGVEAILRPVLYGRGHRDVLPVRAAELVTLEVHLP